MRSLLAALALSLAAVPALAQTGFDSGAVFATNPQNQMLYDSARGAPPTATGRPHIIRLPNGRTVTCTTTQWSMADQTNCY